jgi:hypothetical protein
MARKLDKDTRLIDVDFGPVTVNILRQIGEQEPQGVTGSEATFGGSGTNQFLRSDSQGEIAGSFIQFERLDLDYMTLNNEVMQPMEVSVQRTNAVPSGTHENGNNYEVIAEYLFVFSRPLANNEFLGLVNPYQFFEQVGLNMASPAFGGGYGVNFEQNIYAEQRFYQWNSTKLTSQTTGDLVAGNAALWTIGTQPALETVNTWGSLSAITGPTLYCYRVFVTKAQTKAQAFPADATIFTAVGYGGFSTFRVPPCTISFLCKDPKYSEGEYLTRLANAMNNIPIDGEVA